MFVIATVFPVSYDFCDISVEYPVIHIGEEMDKTAQECVEYWVDLLKSNIDIDDEDGKKMAKSLRKLKKSKTFEEIKDLLEEVHVYMNFEDTTK